MTLTHEEMTLIFEVVGATAAASAFGATVFGWLCCKALELIEEGFRKRGARAPFVERAEAYEQRARRWAAHAERVAVRNRREAIRRGDWVDEG